ncbi:MAG: lipoprotein signal peptidase [Cytophagales bacterium]|nr:lipoprotein signal peptidase [Cytophagales bacterium]
MKYLKYFLLSLGVIVLDQAVKTVVHQNMYLGEEIRVLGDWFKIHYTRNPGMAFGIVLDHEYGKLVLSVFRLLAMFGIGYYLYYLIKKQMHPGLLWCTALILAGAVGNVIDSTFYGKWFGFIAHTPNPNPTLPPVPPPTPWFHGEVVDMLYLDIWKGYLPEWLPLMGGEYYSLWPIFNIADASIFVGVAVILIMQRRFFAHPHETPQTSPNSTNTTETPDYSATENGTTDDTIVEQTPQPRPENE